MSSATKRAVIYTRISLDRSGEGVALSRQEEACRALATARGWEVLATYSDTQSAWVEKKRPQWEAVLELAERGEIDVILAYQMDRITRSVQGFADLLTRLKGTAASIVTAQGDLDLSNETGKLLAGILTNVAAFEVERKSTRQRLANRHRAAAGHAWASGFRAFGYELDGTLVPAEAEHIRTAAADALNGTSMRELARRWNGLGLRSIHAKDSEGKGWTARGIRSLLVNPRYAGIATYKGEILGAGSWEPILSELEHAQLRAKLTDPSRRTRSGSGRHPEHLLSTVAVCSICEATVTGRTSNGVPSYSCPKNCVGTHRDPADAYVLDVFASAVKTFGPVALFASPAKHAPDVEDVGGEIEDLTERRTTLTRLYLSGSLPAPEYEAGLHEVNERLAALEQVSAASSTPVLITEGADDYLREFGLSPKDSKRDTLARILEIRLAPKGKGRRNVPIENQVLISVRLGPELVPSAGFHPLTLDNPINEG